MIGIALNMLMVSSYEKARFRKNTRALIVDLPAPGLRIHYILTIVKCTNPEGEIRARIFKYYIY
jgi:hypothetical protein